MAIGDHAFRNAFPGRIPCGIDINSIRSVIVSGGGDPPNQLTKLSQLKAAAGNPGTRVFRAWPLVEAAILSRTATASPESPDHPPLGSAGWRKVEDDPRSRPDRRT